MPVALIGLPGVGKTTVGRRLARELGCDFVDVDAAIESREGCSIAELFARDGEGGFREVERAVLAATLAGPEAVVATGGGAILLEANRALLAQQAYCVWLTAPFERLVDRIERRQHRPLFAGVDPRERLEQLRREREPLYRDAAALTVDTAGQPLGKVVGQIARRYRARHPAGAVAG